MYDMIQVHCGYCGNWIGEIEYDSIVIEPRCGACYNPTEASIHTTSLKTKVLTLYKKESGMD
jgi:hypothetical protein